MSLPTFPSISPEITRDQALNMILTSIAMEELGLSHIINAEGEKLQYVLGTLPGLPADLCLRTSSGSTTAGSLLNNVMQNQVFLKNKMERVLDGIGKTRATALREPPVPRDPPELTAPGTEDLSGLRPQRRPPDPGATGRRTPSHGPAGL